MKASGIALLVDYSESSFYVRIMNYPSIFNHYPWASVQIPSRLGLEICTVDNPGTLKNGEEDAIFANEVVQHLDDLTAIVGKCNPKPQAISNDRSSISIPSAIAKACVHESELFPESLDWKERNSRVHHGQSGAMRQHTTAEFCSPTKRRRVYEQGEQAAHEFRRKRSGGLVCTASPSARESHILLERLRRREMTNLFSRLRSLLPNPTFKSDKASIVLEIINYIQSLKQRLEICSNQGDIKQPGSSAVPLNSETINSVVELEQTPPSDCYSKFCHESLTLNYNANDILITLKSEKKLNLLPSILLGIESQNIRMVDAFVSTTDAVAFYSLHVKSREILDPVAKEMLHCTLNKLMRTDSQKLGTLTTKLQTKDPCCSVI